MVRLSCPTALEFDELWLKEDRLVRGIPEAANAPGQRQAQMQIASQSRLGRPRAAALDRIRFASITNSSRSLRAGLELRAVAEKENAAVGLADSKTSAIVAGTTRTTLRIGIQAGA